MQSHIGTGEGGLIYIGEGYRNRRGMNSCVGDGEWIEIGEGWFSVGGGAHMDWIRWYLV